MPPPPRPTDSYFNQRFDDYPSSAGHWATASGLPPPPQGPSLFGLGQSSSGLGGAVQAILPMISEMFRGPLGGFGFNFGSDMNVAASEFARQFMIQTMEARRAGAAADSGQVNDVLRGLARMIGHEPVGRFAGRAVFSGDVESSMGRLTGDITTMLPVLAAMFPDSIDRFLPRGSMAVGAASFVNAGRFLTDPVTGRPLSQDPQFGVRVLSELTADRSGRSTAGLGAGRLGQTFEQLTAMGMVGSGEDLRGLNALSAVGLPGGDVARGIQTERIKEQIKAYSQVVASINDIFAESGRPNAPMAELVRGLQTMTQGGLGHYDPATLTRIVRTFHGATQLSGMSTDQLLQLSAATGGALRRYGGHESLAAPIATYAAAVRQAAANLGFGRPSLEDPTVDRFRDLVADSLAGGAGSEQMNLMGALIVQSRYAAAGTPLAEAGAALRAGRTTVDVGGRTVDLMNADVTAYEDLFRRSGLDPRALTRQVVARNQNRGAVSVELTRAAQANEFYQQARAYVQTDLAGGDGAEADRILGALYAASMDGTLTTDADRAMAAARMLGRDDRFASLLGPALTQMGGLTRFGSGGAAFRAYGPALAASGDERLAAFAEFGDKRQQLAHLQRGGWLRNIGRAVVNQGTGEGGWVKFLTDVAGMATEEEVFDARMAPTYDRLRRAFPGAGGVAMGRALDSLLSARGFSASDTLGAAIGAINPALAGAAGAEPLLKAAGERREAVAAGKAVDMKVDIAKLEITAVAGGALSAILSAGGTMTGGGTAVPPGGK